MNTKKITITFAFVAVAAAAALPFNSALAQSPSVQAARDAAQQQIDKVVAPVAAPDAAPADDFASRLAAAVSIVDLTVTEATDAAAKLDPLTKSTDPALAQAASELLPLVRGYQAYAQLLQTQLRRPTLTDDQLSEIAGSLGQWRKKLYDPGMHQALDAILLAQGSDVLNTAQRRFEKVKADVITLQRSFGANANALAPHLDSAKRYIGNAQNSYDAAHGTFTSDQDAFSLTKTTGVVGTLSPATFSRGADGDFTCVLHPTAANPRACVPVFKTTVGYYYFLVNAAGIPLSSTSLSDVYRVSGQVITIKPIFDGDSLVGTMFVEQINRGESGQPKSNSLSDLQSASANILDSMLGKTPVKSVQESVADEISSIKSAYNEFVSMSRLARMLTK